MPVIKTVKQITIGSDTRDIAAKYDEDNREIKTTYLKIKDALTEDLADARYQTILSSGINIKTINGESILGSGNYNLTSEIGKEIEFVEDEAELFVTLSSVRHVKIIIYSSDVSDNQTAVEVKFNEEVVSGITYDYLLKGSSFEVFDSLLICTNNLGNTEVIRSAKPISSLSIKDTNGASLSALIFTETFGSRPTTQQRGE